MCFATLRLSPLEAIVVDEVACTPVVSRVGDCSTLQLQDNNADHQTAMLTRSPVRSCDHEQAGSIDARASGPPLLQA